MKNNVSGKKKNCIYLQAYQEDARGQIAPGPQAPRGLITPNASRSGSLVK